MDVPRLRSSSFLASLAVHAAAAALAWGVLSRSAARRDWISATLVAGPEPAAAPDAAATPAGPRGAAPASPGPSRPERLRTFPGPVPPAGPPPPAVFETRLRPGPPSATSGFWSERSLATYVEGLRRGEVPRDSILDPAPTAEQAALDRATEALNQFTLRLRGEWALERFREKYAENFPAMR